MQSLWRALSFDTWVFASLVGGYALALALRLDDVAAGAMMVATALGCIALYLLANGVRVRWLLVYAAVAAIALAPAVIGIVMRHTTASHLFVHDGMIQTEEAAKFFLTGKNPYVENYFGTPLENWWIPGPNEPPNPALYHFVYLPFTFIFIAPFFVLAQTLFGWFDLRLIFLPLFFITLMLLPRMTASPAKQRALVLLFALNPLLVPFLAEGRNDAFVLFWLVLSVVLLQARRPIPSVAAMACACATKHMAWLVLPFYTHYFFETYVRTDVQGWAMLIRRASVPLVTFLILFGTLTLPFLLWNPQAFMDDVFRYPTGGAENPYPIRSIGFGRFALALGWIPNDTAMFPFERLQLLFGVPALLGLLWFLHNRISISRFWLCCGILTFVVSFFARVFNDNYLGYLLNLILLGVIADDV
jgi:hypothetical protein